MFGRYQADPGFTPNPDTGVVLNTAAITGSGILINGQPVRSQATMTFTQGFSDFHFGVGPFTINADGSSRGKFVGRTVDPILGIQTGTVTLDYGATRSTIQTSDTPAPA
jgi:hypothetical protein